MHLIKAQTWEAGHATSARFHRCFVPHPLLLSYHGKIRNSVFWYLQMQRSIRSKVLITAMILLPARFACERPRNYGSATPSVLGNEITKSIKVNVMRFYPGPQNTQENYTWIGSRLKWDWVFPILSQTHVSDQYWFSNRSIEPPLISRFIWCPWIKSESNMFNDNHRPPTSQVAFVFEWGTHRSSPSELAQEGCKILKIMDRAQEFAGNMSLF
jgi:hypothetical protein